MSRRLLLVVTSAVEPEALRAELERRGDAEPPEVRVVAPPPVSRLHWLTNDEDAERGLADGRAERAAAALENDATNAETIPEVNESDPIQAIEDALNLFAADEIVVVTGPEREAGWLEQGVFGDDLERFGLPVSHLVVSPA